MFSNKIKASEFYFEQPAQHFLLNKSDIMMELSQIASPSGSQKLELSQIPNSQDLFVETPGLEEPADHEIPNSAYDRYMHFKPFQPYTFPSKKCLQKIPSSSELADTKSQNSDEHSEKLDSIYDVVKEILEVVKPLKNDINVIKVGIVDQKNILMEAKTSWDEKWSKASTAFKNVHIMSDIKSLTEATADEVETSKMKFGEFVQEEVSNMKQYLNDYLRDNKEIMNQNADKICMEICKLQDQVLVETRDMHHVLTAEVEKILWNHASNITKQMKNCIAGLQAVTSSTLNSIKETVDKWNHNRDDNRQASQPFYINGNNGYQFRFSNANMPSSLTLHGNERRTPNMYQPSSAYMPYSRNTGSATLNNTFHHRDSSDFKEERVDSFFNDLRFINKQKKSVQDMIFQKKPSSGYNPKQTVPPYLRKLKPLDMNAGATGQERIYQNDLRKDDSVQQITFNSPKPNVMRNVMTNRNEDNILPTENKFKIDHKRIKVEMKNIQSTSGANTENVNTQICENMDVTSSLPAKCSSDTKANAHLSSTPNSRKVYMLRSQQKRSYGNKENNPTQYCGRPDSVIKNFQIIENDDSSDSCVIIDD